MCRHNSDKVVNVTKSIRHRSTDVIYRRRRDGRCARDRCNASVRIGSDQQFYRLFTNNPIPNYRTLSVVRSRISTKNKKSIVKVVRKGVIDYVYRNITQNTIPVVTHSFPVSLYRLKIKEVKQLIHGASASSACNAKALAVLINHKIRGR